MLTDRDHSSREAAGPKDRRLSDGRGLTLRVYPTGRKAWELRFRIATASSARSTSATSATATGSAGLPPRAAKRNGCATCCATASIRASCGSATPQRAGPLYAEVAEAWYRLTIADKFRRPEQVRALLDRHILPRLGARPITELKRGDLFLFVAGIADGSGNDGRGASRVAAQVLGYLKRLVRLCRFRRHPRNQSGRRHQGQGYGLVASRARAI